MSGQPSFPSRCWKPVIEGLGFPEGPSVAPDGQVVCSDMETGIVRGTTVQGPQLVVATGRRISGTAWGPGNRLFIASTQPSGILVFDPATDELDVLLEGQDFGVQCACDLVFASDGTLYFTDAGLDEQGNEGGMWERRSDGSVRRLLAHLTYANGIVLDEARGLLYVAETTKRRITRVELDGGRHIVATTHVDMAGDLGPDGLALDAEGDLYVAHYDQGTIAVFGLDGQPKLCLPTQGRRPTNLTFGGSGMASLYVTEVDAGALLSTEAPTCGGSVAFGPPLTRGGGDSR